MVGMAPWTIYPAIDLRHGRCVRLLRGDFAAETVFSDDPVAVAQQWVGQGACALHVVDLDGALQGAPMQLDWLRAIAQAVSVPIQWGGGLRSASDVSAALDAGAVRVVIGTAAQDPAFFGALVQRWGADRLVAGLDAKGDHLAVAGWQKETALDVLDVAKQLRAVGASQALYTQVDRDGTLDGPDIAGLRRILPAGLRVIASGGVHTIGDIAALAQLAPNGVSGVIVGRALYTGALDLAAALAVSSGG